MENDEFSDEPRRRRMPQKGFPQFRYRSIEAEVEDARTSVRRWWWEYLRLSKDYWLICKTSPDRYRPQTTDDRVAQIFRAFGNVHEGTFDDWWRKIGSRRFEEKAGPPTVLELLPDRTHPHFDPSKVIRLEIPLTVSRRTIQRQVSQILKRYEDLRPRSRLETSRSEYPINPVRFRLHTLQVMHEVYCLHRELIAKPAALRNIAKTEDARREWKQHYEHRADLYRIGKLLRISPSNERLSGDEMEIRAKQNRMRASVSRYLRRADQLISNVEYGQFPVFKDIKKPESRFTKRQLAHQQELELEWWSLNLSSELSGEKVDAARLIYYTESGTAFA